MEVELGRVFVSNGEQSDNNSDNNPVIYHTAITITANDVFIQTLVVNTVLN